MGAVRQLIEDLRADAGAPENASCGPAFLAGSGTTTSREMDELRAFFSPCVLSEELEEWFEFVGVLPSTHFGSFSPAEAVKMAKFQRVWATHRQEHPGVDTDLNIAFFDQQWNRYDPARHFRFPKVLVPLLMNAQGDVLAAEIGLERRERSALWLCFDEMPFMSEAHCLADVIVGLRHALLGDVVYPYGVETAERLELDDWDLLGDHDPAGGRVSTQYMQGWPTSWQAAEQAR